jgi:ubiquinone/menaquinone biosynthesis C-methylase UbiE
MAIDLQQLKPKATTRARGNRIGIQVPHDDTRGFYDRIAKLYDLSFKFNGYGRSVEGYLAKHLPDLNAGARILDAGCGTGLLTLALLKTIQRPVDLTAIDLSHSSLVTARKACSKSTGHHKVDFMQANILRLPFEDHSFDMIVTSGVLEYVPLHEGLREIARVLIPDGYLLHLPVVPSPASRVLEYLFQFKTHPTHEVDRHTNNFFRVVTRYRFSVLDPIGWTKKAILSQKI